MANLPIELMEKTLLSMDDRELGRMCQLNEDYRSVCNDDRF